LVVSSGTVDFTVDGGVPIVCSGGAPIVGGIATCNCPGLVSGSFLISAAYTGDGKNNVGGSVGTINEIVQ
jgi:hypothetical protein